MNVFLLCLSLLILFLDRSAATTDVKEFDLQFLSHHLTDDECRQLIEALHSSEYMLTALPDGSHTMTNRTCIQLLEVWNNQESKGESFARLVGRLREIGRPDLAEKVSRAVLKDVSDAARLTLHDPALAATDEVIVLHKPPSPTHPDAAHIPDFDGRPPESTGTWKLTDWTLAQMVLFVISSTATIGLFGYWFIYCIPDCVRGLVGVLRRHPQRSRDDAAQLLLNEMDDADL